MNSSTFPLLVIIGKFFQEQIRWGEPNLSLKMLLQKHLFKINMLLNPLGIKNLKKKKKKKKKIMTLNRVCRYFWPCVWVAVKEKIMLMLGCWYSSLMCENVTRTSLSLFLIKLTAFILFNSHLALPLLSLLLSIKKNPLKGLTFAYSHMLFNFIAIIFTLVTNKAASVYSFHLNSFKRTFRKTCVAESPIAGYW